jgi:hypothetical protein
MYVLRACCIKHALVGGSTYYSALVLLRLL